MDRPGLHDWSAQLRHVAAPVLIPPSRLGLGQLEPAFLAAVSDPPQSPTAVPPTDPTGEVALWWAILDPAIDVDRALAAPTEGSLLPQGLYRTIEVWTEADLCGLHALWRLWRTHGRDAWQRRIHTVRDWHLENTQPDNATNRPWALHVFLAAGTPEAEHYAATLLHNALAVHGRPEPLSAAHSPRRSARNRLDALVKALNATTPSPAPRLPPNPFRGPPRTPR